jgi:hypothetical protein
MAESGMDSALTASQAKYEFFLTPADLASLPSMRVALFGCGNAKLFSKHNLLALSLQKYGESGLEKKRASRAKRDVTKRMREDDAKQFAKTLLAHQGVSKKQRIEDTDSSSLPRPPPADMSPEAWEKYGEVCMRICERTKVVRAARGTYHTFLNYSGVQTCLLSKANTDNFSARKTRTPFGYHHPRRQLLTRTRSLCVVSHAQP